MEKLYIICIEDQREVLRIIADNLAFFEDKISIEECETAEEALEVMEEIDAAGDYVAVIVSDHVMPEQSGVDFLIEIHEDGRFKHTKKILLTGQATHLDTIEAINKAHIDRYIEKPWDKENLIQEVRQLLTMYVISKGLSYESYMSVLDAQVLFELLKQNS